MEIKIGKSNFCLPGFRLFGKEKFRKCQKELKIKKNIFKFNPKTQKCPQNLKKSAKHHYFEKFLKKMFERTGKEYRKTKTTVKSTIF